LEVKPDVLLIDEVLGVGDAHFAEKSKQALEGRFSSDSTVILVSHNHELIRSMCDRAVWIEAGVSRAQGPVDSVVDAYLASL
jgi:lipopolysaccharide transport system ATP-binding protein